MFPLLINIANIFSENRSYISNEISCLLTDDQLWHASLIYFSAQHFHYRVQLCRKISRISFKLLSRSSSAFHFLENVKSIGSFSGYFLISPFKTLHIMFPDK